MQRVIRVVVLVPKCSAGNSYSLCLTVTGSRRILTCLLHKHGLLPFSKYSCLQLYISRICPCQLYTVRSIHHSKSSAFPKLDVILCFICSLLQSSHSVLVVSYASPSTIPVVILVVLSIIVDSLITDGWQAVHNSERHSFSGDNDLRSQPLVCMPNKLYRCICKVQLEA